MYRPAPPYNIPLYADSYIRIKRAVWKPAVYAVCSATQNLSERIGFLYKRWSLYGRGGKVCAAFECMARVSAICILVTSTCWQWISAQVVTRVVTESSMVASLAPYYVSSLVDCDTSMTAEKDSKYCSVGVQVVDNIATLQVDTSTAGSQWGTGGMSTKLTAARIACAAGCHMAICHSENLHRIRRIMAGEELGTVFKPLCSKIRDRKRWILSGMPQSSVQLVCFKGFVGIE